jgi:hypothetical protein
VSLIDQDLQQWSELSEKATPGPWVGPRITDAWPPGYIGIYDTDEDEPYCVVALAGHLTDVDVEQAQLDAKFIAIARSAVPALIAEVKKLRKLVDPDAEHARLVLIKDATDAAIAEVGPKMDANYGEIIERLVGEKERLRVEVERLSNVYAVAASLRTFPVPFDDHLRLVDAVDAAHVVERNEGQP